jgi:hypothetical protein
MRFRLVLAMVAVAGVMTGVASAAAKPRTSVSLQIAAHGSFKGRLSSPAAGCLPRRVVRLEKHEGRKWVTVTTAKTNRAGRFQGTLRGGLAGRYRAVAVANGSCASGTSKTVGAPAGTGSGQGAGSGHGGGSGPGGGSTPSGGGSGPQQPACSLPLTHDTYDGFHIGVPSGWELLALRGELTVEKDAVGSEAAIVAPAAQTSGVTPASYFQSELSTIESVAASAGGTITVTGNGSQNGIPSATFTWSVGGQTLSGQATVLVEPLAGQASSTELVFSAYWAPSAVFGTESSLLSSIAGCYGPERASLYRIFQDAAFTYMLPPGWSNAGEDPGSNSLELTDGQGDYVGYALLHAVSTFQFNSPQSLIDAYLAGVQITSVTSLWSATPPGQGGGPGNTEYEEFTGSLGGTPVHGVIYGEVTNAGGVYSGVVRLGLATAANWNAVNGALIQMAGFIQHDFTQDLQTINQINQQWQSFSNQVANFDDILNNQQLTQDPMTGIYYDAPYDSYEIDGPNGPGYYNNAQLLNIINRP